MSNVIGVKNEPKTETRIMDMSKGQVGYTVPWSYKDGHLDEEYTVCEKGGTAYLRVECVKPGLYSLTFEEPKYRNIFEGLKNE